MTIHEKFNRLNEHSIRTHDEAIECMEKYGKVMIVRPTGFGKTRLLVKIAKEYAKSKGKKVLYVYPLGVIETEVKRKKDYMCDGVIDEYVDFKSYQLLTKRLREDGGSDYWYNKIKDDYAIILLDEVHRAGSEGFLEFYEVIKDLIRPDGIHLIGVTATPNRMMDTEDSNVMSIIFDGITTYRFELGDAFREGILLPIIYAGREYDMDNVVDQFKAFQKENCKKNGTQFDENVFNVELGKVLKEVGGEAEYIYTYIKEAGYDLASQNDSYLKFIVFFVDIADMVERGPIVEDWFNNAMNTVAKKDRGLRKDFDVHSYYIASSDTEDNGIVSLVLKDKEHRAFYKKTSKLNDVERQPKRVDLLFTVNMINMGYHVEDISGIMMLRGTKSEIIFYQQLGRCLSVIAEKSPIVYDMVYNINMNFRTREERKNMIKQAILGVTPDREATDYGDIEIFQTGHHNAWEEFQNRWSDTLYSEKSKAIWMYTDRNAPLCVIAQELDKSCSEVAKILVNSEIELRPEDAMYKFYEQDAIADKSGNALKLMKFIYFKKARDMYQQVRGTIQGLYTNILQLLGIKER